MSKIEKLIWQLCPEGVEFKDLGEVCEYVRGITYSKDDEIQSTDGIKVLRANNVSLNSNTVNFTDIKIVSKEVRVKDKQKLKKNDILICAASGSKAHIGKVAFIFSDIEYYFGGFMAVLRVKIDLESRFLFHLLIGKSFSKYLETALNTTTINNLNSQIMNGFHIPIPPLPIQHEIVSILDKFNALDAELVSELEARKKQYEYYRNQLLNFEGKEVEWKTLGDIGEFVRGQGLQKKDFTETGVGCIHYGQIYTFYGMFANKTKSFVSVPFSKKLRKAQKGDIIIATTSENVQDVCKSVVWLGDEEIAVSGETYIYKHNQNAKFLAYYLQADSFLDFKKQNVTGTKVIRVHGEKLKKFILPIPSLAVQAEIVAILDNFDTLLNDNSVGLPAEIKSRRKQYEYYRGKLLKFKRLNQHTEI